MCVYIFVRGVGEEWDGLGVYGFFKKRREFFFFTFFFGWGIFMGVK